MIGVLGRNWARISAGSFALGVATTLLVVLAVGGVRPRAAEAGPRHSLGRTEFHEALDDILDRYVEPVDEAALLSRGLKHIVAGLDPHSHFLTASERKALRRRASRGSTGLAVVMKLDDDQRWLEIVAVAPGSPADLASLVPGDHVLSIKGRDISDFLSQAEVEAALVGRVGDPIELVVQRERSPAHESVSLELTAPTLDAVEDALVNVDRGKVAHLRIRRFVHETGEQVKRRLAALRRAAGTQGLSGIVLDLRDNPGGAVDEALVVADLFVERGTLTRTRGRGGRILREEQAHESGSDTATPLVVLQDRHTASAAELLAVALQENGRAKIVGERSYGKGTVQDVIGLDDGSLLTLTIARYFSPKDRLIDGNGVSPDTHVIVHEDETKALDAALESLGLERQ